jgi:hypothetical protein
MILKTIKKIIFGLLISLSLYTNAQPTIEWQKCFGGSNYDIVRANPVKTTDDGYILTCGTYSNNGDVSGNNGGLDTWVVKMSNLGTIQWQKCLGGSNTDYGLSIITTSDGGYILTGRTESNDGDVSGNHGQGDFWVVKLSSFGNIEWQKCLGGSNDESGLSIKQTSDGNYILIGITTSNNGDVSGNHGNIDAWVVKISNLGTIQWQKCLGGSNNEDIVPSINTTSDGGYILTGRTESNDGDVSGNHGQGDIWVVKLSSFGNIEWQKCLGGSNNEYGHSIQQTVDGGYVLIGSTTSNNGDVSGNNGDQDVWVVKLSSFGDIEWQKCLGGSNKESGLSIQQTTDEGYVFCGSTSSNNGDVSGYHGGFDTWLVKLSSFGNIEWQKCLGGSDGEDGSSIQQTTDGSYILSCDTYSNNADVSGNHGDQDVWVVKLSSKLDVMEQTPNNLISLYPNPVNNVLNLKLDKNFENVPFLITDVEGKTINTGIINDINTSINVELLSSGIYFMKVGDNNCIKFIKE